jgi:hypothetical protein
MCIITRLVAGTGTQNRETIGDRITRSIKNTISTEIMIMMIASEPTNAEGNINRLHCREILPSTAFVSGLVSITRSNEYERTNTAARMATL